MKTEQTNRIENIWDYFSFLVLFILDVILTVYDFYVGDVVSSCFDGFFMGMLFMSALNWWLDNSEK